MTTRSGHVPTQRLVARPNRGPMPDTNLFAHVREPETIDERFEVWIGAHPEVLDDFIELALEARAAGHKRVGAKAICEVLRWRSFIRRDDDGYKLNNVYVSRLVRRAIDRRPELDGMFEIRKLTSA